MSVFHNNALIGSGGGAAAAAAAGPIKSLRFNDSDSAYLSKTPSSSGNQTTWTWAGWVKRSKLGGSLFQEIFGAQSSGTNYFVLRFTSGDKIDVFDRDSSGAVGRLTTTQVFRDPGAWLHITYVWDSSNSTAADRRILYVNGVRVTDFDTEGSVSQNHSSRVNSTIQHGIGAVFNEYLSGYLADVYFIDGSALSPVDNFIELDNNGVYQAKEYSGTFGTNGFHLLDFANESTVGHDSSGNENDFTANNISTTAGAGNDVLFDVPTNDTTNTDSGAGGEISGNYAVFNAVEDAASGGNAALSNGNLQIDGSSSEQFRAATIPVTSGKWYFEITQSAGTDFGPGVWAYPLSTPSSAFHQNENYRYNSNGGVYDESAKITDYSSFAVGDVIGTALDMDNGKVYFSKNGTWQNSGNPANQTNPAATGLTGQWVFGASTNGNNTTLSANFGASAFAYSAPTGFKALNTASMSAATIADGSAYFDVDTYAGTGASHERSEFSFSPDWVWIKSRTSTNGHNLYDVVRGANKYLSSNLTNAEGTATNELMSFDSDGFTLGDAAGVNGSSKNYVAWAWDAGSSTASNTDGSVTSSVRANQTAGFSIVKWTATNGSATIGHGLSAAPEMIFVKDIDSSTFWQVFHTSLGNTKAVNLNSTNASSTATNHWNNTSPTSSVFSVGVNSNYLTDDHIAYCFAPVAGFSAFGEYSGNSSSDGVFVHTNFRPAWLMVKSTNASGSWSIFDNKRDPFNVMDRYIFAEQNFAEQDSDVVDFLSNGFKFRTGGGDHNFSGRDYIYIAFAENPFQANGGLAR